MGRSGDEPLSSSRSPEADAPTYSLAAAGLKGVSLAPRKAKLSDADYERLLTLRTRLRGFLRWSEAQARHAGLGPTQHQLLLAVRGHADPRGPTIGEVADYLFLRHHSAGELVERVEQAGFVERRPDPEDARVVRLGLTHAGERALAQLSELHVEELRRLASHLQPLLKGLEFGQDDRGGTRVAN